MKGKKMDKKRHIKYAVRIGALLSAWWLITQCFYNCFPLGSIIHFAKAMDARDADGEIRSLKSVMCDWEINQSVN